jgi:hypothetical protein
VALLRRLERKDKSLERLKAALKKKDVELKTLKKYKTMVQDEANCYLTCNCAVRNQQGPWNPDSPCQKGECFITNQIYKTLFRLRE